MASENTRKRRAVLVSVDRAADRIRLRLDDVVSKDEKSAEWKRVDVFTWKDLEEKSLDELEFDEKELADFGYTIIARLYAFKKRGEL